MADPTPLPLPPVDEKTLRRMWAKIQPPEGCWIWTGSAQRKGYSQSISVNESRTRTGKSYLPHRLMFQWFKFDIPPDLTIDHLCKNRRCVNPDHMEPTTLAENVRRGTKKPYCKHGHKQIPENRYTAPGSGRQRCRLCIGTKNEKRKVARRARGLKKPGRKKEVR